jgi:hypothetical protein
LQWKREGKMTNLPDMATPSIARKTYPTCPKHMDLLSKTLYYLCHRRQHQHMIIRRRKASTDDQPHYPIVDEIKANQVLRSRLDPGDSPCASDRVKVILC